MGGVFKHKNMGSKLRNSCDYSNLPWHVPQELTVNQLDEGCMSNQSSKARSFRDMTIEVDRMDCHGPSGLAMKFVGAESQSARNIIVSHCGRKAIRPREFVNLFRCTVYVIENSYSLHSTAVFRLILPATARIAVIGGLPQLLNPEFRI
jgi:hypothetical protein